MACQNYDTTYQEDEPKEETFSVQLRGADFSFLPEGQKSYLLKIQIIISTVPNALGFCYWGGEWISYKGDTSTEGSTWENQAFWNFDNRALPVPDAFKQN